MFESIFNDAWHAAALALGRPGAIFNVSTHGIVKNTSRGWKFFVEIPINRRSGIAQGEQIDGRGRPLDYPHPRWPNAQEGNAVFAQATGCPDTNLEQPWRCLSLAWVQTWPIRLRNSFPVSQKAYSIPGPM